MDPSNASQSGDVALLVDWENLKFSLAQRERRPNVTALRAAAERFGRIGYGLINNMLTIGVLRFDQQRQGRDPVTGAPYQFNSVPLDFQHPDVRRALKLG